MFKNKIEEQRVNVFAKISKLGTVEILQCALTVQFLVTILWYFTVCVLYQQYQVFSPIIAECIGNRILIAEFTTLIYFSLKLRNGPNELDCYMIQSWKDLPMKNTLAYWAHYEDNNVLWIRSQSFYSWNCFHDTLVDYMRQNLMLLIQYKNIQYHENRQ